MCGLGIVCIFVTHLNSIHDSFIYIYIILHVYILGYYNFTMNNTHVFI